MTLMLPITMKSFRYNSPLCFIYLFIYFILFFLFILLVFLYNFLTSMAHHQGFLIVIIIFLIADSHGFVYH